MSLIDLFSSQLFIDYQGSYLSFATQKQKAIGSIYNWNTISLCVSSHFRNMSFMSAIWSES